MRTHSVDYSKDRHEPGTLINRGFWVHGVPRLIPLCRLLGHRPVVDGTEGHRGPNGHESPGHRWVCCDRCGIRPDPQGSLDHRQWNIGDPYPGPFKPAPRLHPAAVKRLTDKGIPLPPDTPGVWPARRTTTIGGQLVLRWRTKDAGISLKVGNAGSEQVLAGHIEIPGIGALYWHTERHGTWIQRRLNPTGYESRVIEVRADHGRLSWKVWAPRDSWTKGTPRWQHGSITIDPRTLTRGPVRHEFTDVGEPVMGTVRMPDGDDYEVRLKLRQVAVGRRRGRKSHHWCVDWFTHSGIPYRHHDWKGDEVLGSSVRVTQDAVDTGRWPLDACAAIADQVSKDRSRNRWKLVRAA